MFYSKRERKGTVGDVGGFEDEESFKRQVLEYFCTLQHGLIEGTFQMDLLEFSTSETLTSAVIKIPFEYALYLFLTLTLIINFIFI